MAHKKGQGSTRNGRDSNPQYRGVKVYGGQFVPAGAIIVRQRGMTFLAGPGTDLGRDYTVFATLDGRVKFEHEKRDKKRVRIVPEAATQAGAKA